MSEKKNWDKIAKIEKAVKDKYGEAAIKNPKSDWSDEQEQEYLQQIKQMESKQRVWRAKTEKVEVQEGVFVSKKLLKREDGAARICPVCSEYSFDLKDDLYMNKFECCWSCYINHVEGREERWNEGWRPHSKQK
tara:strand:+ start:755 stop:1156 length:402 start_codon:yes stop_codon:yes gene_type:complete